MYSCQMVTLMGEESQGTEQMNSHPIIQLIHEISMQIPKLDPLRPCVYRVW